MLVLLLVAGCQSENSIGDSPTPPSLPVLPPTVEPEPTPTPVTPESPAIAEFPIYAHTDEYLFEVEPLTGMRSALGSFGLDNELHGGMTDIAIDNQGRMYGGTQKGHLFRIDAVTAQAEWVCQMGTERQMYALAFTPGDDPQLVASGSDGSILIVDTDNCASDVVLTSNEFDTAGDLVGLPDGYLYWTVEGEEPYEYDENRLVRIDPDSWFTQELGIIPVGKLYGLGYHDGQLFGFSGDVASSGQESRIVVLEPPSVGNSDYLIPTTTLWEDNELMWWGATTNPVAWDED